MLTFLLLWPLVFLLAFMVWGWFQQTTELPFPDSLRVGIRLMLAVMALGVLLPVVVSAVKFRRAANKSAASPWLGILIGSALFSLIPFGAYVPAVFS